MVLLTAVVLSSALLGDVASAGVTSLTNPGVRYTKPVAHHVVLERGGRACRSRG